MSSLIVWTGAPIYGYYRWIAIAGLSSLFGGPSFIAPNTGVQDLPFVVVLACLLALWHRWRSSYRTQTIPRAFDDFVGSFFVTVVANILGAFGLVCAPGIIKTSLMMRFPGYQFVQGAMTILSSPYNLGAGSGMIAQGLVASLALSLGIRIGSITALLFNPHPTFKGCLGDMIGDGGPHPFSSPNWPFVCLVFTLTGFAILSSERAPLKHIPFIVLIALLSFPVFRTTHEICLQVTRIDPRYLLNLAIPHFFGTLVLGILGGAYAYFCPSISAAVVIQPAVFCVIFAGIASIGPAGITYADAGLPQMDAIMYLQAKATAKITFAIVVGLIMGEKLMGSRVARDAPVAQPQEGEREEAGGSV